MDIVALFQCLHPHVTTTTLRHASPGASGGEQEHHPSRSVPHAGVRAYQRHARRLTPTDRRVYPMTSLVLDGHFGTHHALPMARQSYLPLMSKRRCDAALSLPYAGPSAGRGPHRTYGRKRDDGTMPEKYRKETTVEGHIQTRMSQAQLLHKEFAHPLNVVIIAKTNLHTQARAHVLLFSSDLELASTHLVDSSRLRCQIACNFCDAKQSWGLEDLMNVTPTGVTNAANLSLFMVNVSYRLQAAVRSRDPDYSILDLKADCRGYKYVEETIHMLPEKPVVSLDSVDDRTTKCG